MRKKKKKQGRVGEGKRRLSSWKKQIKAMKTKRVDLEHNGEGKENGLGGHVRWAGRRKGLCGNVTPAGWSLHTPEGPIKGTVVIKGILEEKGMSTYVPEEEEKKKRRTRQERNLLRA